MSGSLLRLVSVLLLTVVTGVSTARTLCVLPCRTGAAVPDAASSGHCDHDSSEPATALETHAGACGTCDDLGIDRADRLSSRSSIALWLATPARLSGNDSAIAMPDLVERDSDPPPGLRTLVAASLPLRI